MAHQTTIFQRLRSMRTEGSSLSELIAQAADVGDELVEAIEALLSGCAVLAQRNGIDIEAECLAFDESPFAKARRASFHAREAGASLSHAAQARRSNPRLVGN
jgi:hypothetical protein